MEMEIKNERQHKSVQQITHPFHRQHPLVLVAEQSNEGLKDYCDGCGELLSAPCFTCIHCKYHLHKQCAEAPLSLPNHPLHPQHSDAVIVVIFASYAKRNFLELFMVALFAISTSMLDVLGRGPLLKIKVIISTHSPYFGDKTHLFVMHVALKEIIFHIYVQHAASWSIRIALHSHASSNFLDMITAFFTNIFLKSSIIRVIEVNEAGEATKIEHFSHQHCLVLAYKMEEEIDRKCDWCMLPISNIVYYCSQCPFFLHKSCAELPRIKQHWFRQSNANFKFDSFKFCGFCCRHFSGFFYYTEGWWMCLRCAKVSDIIKCEGHQHFLFFDFKWCDKYCNGCGNRCWSGAFRCGKCRFALDFGCLTLPHSVLHKIDEHKLNRTYHDDKEQSYCDICEQKGYPSLWYYFCSICDTSAHLKCVIGEFPFLKDGSIVPSYYYSHNHDLKFFRKVEGYLKCSYCSKLYQEEILKCEKPACNYIIHNKCRWVTKPKALR
ncbi:hypothetical protein CXB51_015602 [Gossypium anomalum]|uniref:DC1 domain-containing protein n=1 Tax=Gossypium anomalum TaxID=47600 RepID=A0A8J5YYS8_9ROSI|nr:hypothetical protein CXB51_015602 [Gossypium anomalum]